MQFPMFRTMKSSPGSALVIRFGSTRESEHVMKSVSGLCPCVTRRSNISRRFPKTFFSKWWIPWTSFRMAGLP